jgi:hypothetical protein
MSDNISNLSKAMSLEAVWKIFSFTAEPIFPGKTGDAHSWQDKVYICVSV